LATPEDFDAEAAAQLQRLYGILVEQSTWRDHDIDVLERYVRREMDARIYRQALKDDGRFQHSARGGRVYAHPAIDKERDANRDIASLADQLVLTPDARRRHGENEEQEQGDLFNEF
jgi:P27 family predicted phage terminase small subunit